MQSCGYRVFEFQDGKDKTNSILFSRKKNISERTKENRYFLVEKNKHPDRQKLDIRRGDMQIKQHTSVTYLGCILDENLSGESMATRSSVKSTASSDFFTESNIFLISPFADC